MNQSQDKYTTIEVKSQEFNVNKCNKINNFSIRILDKKFRLRVKIIGKILDKKFRLRVKIIGKILDK